MVCGLGCRLEGLGLRDFFLRPIQGKQGLQNAVLASPWRAKCSRKGYRGEPIRNSMRHVALMVTLNPRP